MTYVEETKVKGPEKKEGPHREQRVRHLLEGADLDQGGALPGAQARLQQHVAHDTDDEGHEPGTAHRPRKPDLGDEVLHGGRERDGARARARGGDGEGQGLLAIKVRADNGGRGHPHEPQAKTRHQTLCEKDLPVLRRQARQESAQDHHHRAHQHGSASIARIGQGAAHHAGGVVQEDLKRADPGDLRGGQVEVIGVVELVDAKRGSVAAGDGVDEVTGNYLPPGHRAAVGGRAISIAVGDINSRPTVLDIRERSLTARDGDD